MVDPRHGLTNLLTGFGYNLYDTKNRARADDLLVREKAAERIADAANFIRGLRTAYHRRYIPTPSRENPDPPPERLEQLRTLARVHQRLADLDTDIRGMAVPTQDRVWEHFRGESSLLNQLLLFDYRLVSSCQTVSDRVAGLGPSDWNDETAADFERALDDVERVARQRRDFLSVPG